MEDECYPCMPPGSLPVTNNSSVVKEEPLSPAVVEDDPANHLMSELFAPASNLRFIVKDEPKLEANFNAISKAPSMHVLPPSSKASVASIPVFGHANRVVFPKVSLDSRKAIFSET